MAESTLARTLQNLEAEVGSYLGWGRGAKYDQSEWTDEQQLEIDSILKSGLANFYFPVPGPGQQIYEWTFLRPWADLTLVADTQTVDLPDDFLSLDGLIYISSSDTSYCPLRQRGDVRGLYAASPTASGTPEFVAVEPVRGTGHVEGQRWQLRLWPQPDSALTVRLRYNLIPEALTTLRPHVYGGAAHSETVLESCLAVAELRKDDLGRGPHAQAFRERLAASIATDRKNRPQWAGYNGDYSDGRRDSRWRDPNLFRNPVTFDGVQY